MIKLKFKDYLSLLICVIIGITMTIVGFTLLYKSINFNGYEELETIGGILATLGLGSIVVGTCVWILHYKLGRYY